MSEMVYDAHLEDLYKKYAALPEMEKRAVETLSVLFGGFYKYVKLRNLSALMGYRLTNPELTDLSSSKLDTMMHIVEELLVNQHQALIFSQFVGHLALVGRVLDERGISYQYLDGSTPVPEREKAVRDFQAGKSPLFLISLKAGGLGLNLTAADYVLHLDPWWNPAIEDQASDRAHRMGQRRPVTIYRMVAKNTIEEKIVQLHATKRDMADAMLERTDQSARLSTADLLALLREV